MDDEPGSARRFHEDIEDWRVLCDGAHAFFRTDSFATSARFVRAINERSSHWVFGGEARCP